ncbi:MAG: hypothetical protein RLZ56_1055 [Bacteroidota bacterium]|jgi:hypothetical protein
MKPIERIAIYLQFKAIAPYSFERKIHLSNGYVAKQLKHNGSVGSDILIRICEHYPDLNMLWVLTGDGSMILNPEDTTQELPTDTKVDEYVMQYQANNSKLKAMEADLEKLSCRIRDKDKIIGLYEFMMNHKNHASSIGDTM